MPASDFSWPAVPRAPIFQVYGTKRKADRTGGAVAGMEQITPDHKRKCVWEECHEQTLMQERPCEPGLEINHNSMEQPSFYPNPHQPAPAHQQQQLAFQQASLNPHVDSSLASPFSQNFGNCVPQPDFGNCVPQPDFGASQTGIADMESQQNAMRMDSYNDAVSSRVAGELESACTSMESDFVPNPNQYSSRSQSGAELRVGDSSPTSGRVRCYCKPSWEGLMDMRPYISDIY